MNSQFLVQRLHASDVVSPPRAIAWWRRAVASYEAFLRLKALTHDVNGDLLVPSVVIDRVWCEHVCDTSAYQAACAELGSGAYLHRTPPDTWHPDARAARYALTYRELANAGTRLDADVWPRPTVNLKRCLEASNNNNSNDDDDSASCDSSDSVPSPKRARTAGNKGDADSILHVLLDGRVYELPIQRAVDTLHSLYERVAVLHNTPAHELVFRLRGTAMQLPAYDTPKALLPLYDHLESTDPCPWLVAHRNGDESGSLYDK